MDSDAAAHLVYFKNYGCALALLVSNFLSSNAINVSDLVPGTCENRSESY